MSETVNQALWDELVQLMQYASTEFNAVRDLPLYGRKQWERHFQKAFQVYARLWSFQQENRAALQDEGLKRWEIGEVASRIGQASLLVAKIPLHHLGLPSRLPPAEIFQQPFSRLRQSLP